VRSGPGEARTILLLHIISVRPSKQPLTVRTFLKVYMELGSYFLFLQEQIKDIIIMLVPASVPSPQIYHPGREFRGTPAKIRGTRPRSVFLINQLQFFIQSFVRLAPVVLSYKIIIA
jgi:hypothetical protein